MTLTTREWVELFAREIGTEPPDDEVASSLLRLAGIAAHASERTAAPISCWLVGRANTEPATALVIGERLASELGGTESQ